MREVILKQLDPQASRQERQNQLRRSLQIILLKILHESGVSSTLAFTGGTALHFLHGLPRFSEDLDFSLIRPDKYDFEKLADQIRLNLEKLSLPSDLKTRSEKNVHHLYVRFREILIDTGLSPHREEKLPIRLEIDTNPPAGWKTQISLLSDIYTIPILHFDLPSSFATKLHACLFRSYAKGRDYYDLMWYTGKKIKPNWTVLNHAIEQTEGKSKQMDGKRLKQCLLAKIEELDVKQLQKDVAPFLAQHAQASLLDHEVMEQVIFNCEF